MSEQTPRRLESFDDGLRHLGSEGGFWVLDWNATPWLGCTSAPMAPAPAHERRMWHGTRSSHWLARGVKRDGATQPYRREVTPFRFILPG